MILSASRDKTVIVWNLTREEGQFGVPVRALRGHAHFVSDVVISGDGEHALTGSWDGTLRLWKISTGETTKRFVGHKKDVLSVAWSADNRRIVSASRDKTIKLWNTLGDCKFTIENNGHSDWVSCVSVSPAPQNPIVVSCGWDKRVKVWTLENCLIRNDLAGHGGYLNVVTVSPDGSLCASGGKDGVAMLWDLQMGQHLYSLPADSQIHALAFSPARYWLCAATDDSIIIWDLEYKRVVADLQPEVPEKSAKALKTACTSLAWSADGTTLFAGYTDNVIRVYQVRVKAE